MLAVIVEFQIKPENISDFHEAMLLQAKISLQLEEGCHYFDVCQDPVSPECFFLYELYTDKEAFDLHLQSIHFQDFDKSVSEWIVQKDVKQFKRLQTIGTS